MNPKTSGPLVLALLTVAGCSFGDRSVRLRSDPPVGEPHVFRGISIVLEEPEDLRPEPHDVVGAVLSGVGVKTADITTDDDVRAWVRESMASELRHAGFLVSPAGRPGFALQVRIRILTLSCEESVGFGATMTLELRVAGDATLLLEKTYQASDRHLVITRTSGSQAADSLRTCLRKILTQFARDLIDVVEASPE